MENTILTQQNSEQSLWTQLSAAIDGLKYKRLADVSRFISFEPFETYDTHSHVRIEINFVRKGSCILHIGNNESITFSEGEMMIIHSNLEHMFEAGPKGVVLMQLEFMPEVFSMFDMVDTSNKAPIKFQDLFSEENRLIKIVNNVRIMQSVQRIVNELKDKFKFHQYLVAIYYAELLLLLQRHINDTLLPLGANEPLAEAIGFIRKNYHDDISIAQVAQHINISERYLRKLFSDNLSISPINYLNQIRINKSIELLKYTDFSIKEIAFKTGYKSPQYFSRIFKRQTGMSPNQINKK